MKNTFMGMLITMLLVLAVVLGAVALAENAGTEAPGIPATEQAAPEEAPAAGQAAPEEAPAADAAANDTALQDAFKAYNEAKSSSHQEALEAELKGYVESGKLTQEQADLILNWYKEQQALRDGVCPNCGYQFQNSQDKNGRGNGGFGGKGGRMNGGKGGRGMMGMNGRQPSQGQQSSQDSGSADGMAFLPGVQAAPDMAGNEGI